MPRPAAPVAGAATLGRSARSAASEGRTGLCGYPNPKEICRPRSGCGIEFVASARPSGTQYLPRLTASPPAAVFATN